MKLSCVFHFSLKTISRSSGRTATAAAAYRSGQSIHCERLGVTHNYQRRKGVEGSFLVGWKGGRAALWNSAEASETRINSVVAREIVVNLPFEFPFDLRRQLVMSLATTLRDKYGVAVDASLHLPSRKGDQRNYHAHLLMTTRAVDEQGLFGSKTRILDAIKTGRVEIEFLRAQWAKILNDQWELMKGHEAYRREDHRSFRRRGLKLVPTQHLGPKSQRKAFVAIYNKEAKVYSRSLTEHLRPCLKFSAKPNLRFENKVILTSSKRVNMPSFQNTIIESQNDPSKSQSIRL